MPFDKEQVEKMGLTWKEGMTDDEVFAELGKIKANADKYASTKSAFDKTSSELAELKKKAKGEQTEAEKQAEKVAELEGKIADYEKQTKLRDIKDTYKNLGYDDKSASDIAEAQMNGDFAKVGSLQKAWVEKHDAELKQQLLQDTKNPKQNDPNAGEPKTYDELIKMGYDGMVEFQKNNPQKYAELTASKDANAK